MGKKILYISAAVLAVVAYFGVAAVSAASIFDIEYPIVELSGCADRAACKQYCDEVAHADACDAFARKFGLAGEKTVKKSPPIPKEGGPGGCDSADACRQYCDDSAHLTECVSFAEQHGLVDKDAARLIKKTAGTGPGGCKGANECKTYCSDPAHSHECIDFAEKNGLMTAEEVKRARTVIDKEGPGGCRGQSCKQFCDTPGNEEACLDFAEREGLIPQEEAARARKFTAASRDGGPGGCRGVQCRNYCEDPAHREECYVFAKDKGLISKEEEQDFEAGSKIEEVVRTAGGPGGCKNDDECRAYCTDPSHVEECVAFGATHGGVPPEQAREMLKRFSERQFEARGPGGFENFGPGEGGFENFRHFKEEANRRFDEFRALEEQFRGKEFPGFSEHGGFPGSPPEGFPGSGEFRGKQGEFPGSPGGTTGGFPDGPSFVGPGGCTSPAECIKYCAERREECFGGGSSGDRQGNSESENNDRNRRGGNGGECCPTPGEPPVRLRTNLIRKFKKDDLPSDFDQRSPEERQQFFRERIQQERGEFPGTSGEFPARPGAFPDHMPQSGFPRPFPGGSEDTDRQPPFPRPPLQPEGTMHPEGGAFPPSPVQGGPEGSGTFFQPPAAGTFITPPGGQFPSGGSLPPPSSPGGSFVPPLPSGGTTFGAPPPPSGDAGGFVPPPPSGSPSNGGPSPAVSPSSAAPFLRLFGSLIDAFAP